MMMAESNGEDEKESRYLKLSSIFDCRVLWKTKFLSVEEMDGVNSLPFASSDKMLIELDPCFETIHNGQAIHIGVLIPVSFLPFFLGPAPFSVCANTPSIQVHSCGRRDFSLLTLAPNNVAAKRSSTLRRKQHLLLVEFRQVLHFFASLQAFANYF